MKNFEKYVAVISYDKNDFLEWKRNNGVIGDTINTLNKISVGNTLYYRIVCPCDLCSKRVSEVQEAPKAKENESYGEIHRMILSQL